ncbi:hydroxyisourate hydrolase [soil metagenome]
MRRLTTHVLDTALGRPAAGLTIELWSAGSAPALLKTVVTNREGRVDGALLEGADFGSGIYELVFHAGDYFKSQNVPPSGAPFLDIIPVRFSAAEEPAHYHIPLLLSPYGYSTYRGS